ncbi:MAG: hypothetical protein B5M51_09570 [Anaerolinea sp. 4484_236]|nr:MAG: hypothetical protein B5M51_09570 [Anaerolinea sp. 4484_236]
MRRSDREITDQAAIEAIIHEAEFCRLALVDGGQPYIIPLSFGYRDKVLYFHSAVEGEKRKAFDIIMAHYSEKDFQIPNKALQGTAIIKMEIDEMTGKLCRA